jgi:hypothetical protein
MPSLPGVSAHVSSSGHSWMLRRDFHRRGICNTEGQGRDYPPDWSPGVRRGFPCGQRSDEFRPRQLSISESQPQSRTFDVMHTTGGDA